MLRFFREKPAELTKEAEKVADRVFNEAAEGLSDAAEGLKDLGEHLKSDPVPPIWRELRRYTRRKFRADLVAGATVALTTIPQAVGFALVAGLPVPAVLACAIVGGAVCALLSSSRHLIFGPTNTISIIVAGMLASLPESELTSLQKVLVFGCLVGFMQLGAGLLKLGSLTQFVSRTVVIAYSAGVAVLIAAGQIGNLLGVGQPERVDLINVVRHLVVSLVTFEFHQPTALVGASSLLFLLLVRRLRPAWSEGLALLVVATAASYLLDLSASGVEIVRDAGEVGGVMPLFTGFPLSGEGAELVPLVFSAALAASILGMLEGISITQSIATRSGQEVDPNRELVAMGAGNLVAAAFGAMAGSASFVRSAVNHQAGGRTQLSGFFSSGILLVLLLLFASTTNFIPIAALAALLLLVAWRLVDWRGIDIVRRATGADAMVFWATFVSVLFLDLDTAIYAGVGISLVAFLQKAGSPTLQEYTFNEAGNLTVLDEDRKRPHAQISIIHVEGALFFGAANIFQSQVRRLAADGDIRVFILRMKNARHLDATTVMALLELHHFLRRSGRYLLISGVSEEVELVLERSGALDEIGKTHVFPVETNPTLSTKRALERAREILQLGKRDTGVRLYYDRPQP